MLGLRACVRGPATSRGVAARLGSPFHHGCRTGCGSPAALCGVTGRETHCFADFPARLRCMHCNLVVSVPRAAAGEAPSPPSPSSLVLEASCAQGRERGCHLRGGRLLSLGCCLYLTSFAGVLDPSNHSIVFRASQVQAHHCSNVSLQAHGSTTVFRVGHQRSDINPPPSPPPPTPGAGHEPLSAFPGS